MKQILDIIQLVSAILLVIAIVLQAKGDGLGAAFGGSGGITSTRRGPERGLFILTIILAIIFFAVAGSRLFLK